MSTITNEELDELFSATSKKEVLMTTEPTDFLPPMYEVPEAGGGYMKFVAGENRLRIMTSPVMGLVYWKETADGRRPVRLRSDEDVDFDDLGKETPKHFWAMVVYNYRDKAIQILELTQKGIMRSIAVLAKNPKWGSPLGYDLVITRKGEGLETEYLVTPDPKEHLSPEIAEMFSSVTIDLEKLYDGSDPFAGGKNG